MRKLRSIQNHILFTFDQNIVRYSDGKSDSTAFQEQTDWGFEFKNFNESAERPRWGTVLVVGPDVDSEIAVGLQILIENLKWTNGIDFDGQMIWRTDEECVLAVRN